MAEYWQKKPLLIRQAIPNFESFLTADDFVSLAIDDDAQARLITNKNGKWQVKARPLDEGDFGKLPRVTTAKLFWTILVQNVNHHLPQAVDLLQQFSFMFLHDDMSSLKLTVFLFKEGDTKPCSFHFFHQLSDLRIFLFDNLLLF